LSKPTFIKVELGIDAVRNPDSEKYQHFSTNEYLLFASIGLMGNLPYFSYLGFDFNDIIDLRKGKEGAVSLRKALNNLIENGYIHKHQTRTSRGYGKTYYLYCPFNLFLDIEEEELKDIIKEVLN
jgi:hypothetical protein